MPGSEGGDRVHNFFEQGRLSQDQHHTQLVEGNWPVLNNNLYGGSERQIGGPLTSGPKNYTTQQSDSDRGKGNQFSLGPYGLNLAQSNLRPEFVKNPSHPQQLNLNGFMHTSQVVHTRQNEANFLGVDAEPDRHNLTSRGLSILEAQQRSGSVHTHSASFRSPESQMNFNFLAGQQQMSGQQPGMLQSLPRQQFAVNEGQLLPQHMLKQMQELQRQKQFQQLDPMQRNVASQIPTFPNQMGSQHSQAISGNPMYDAANYPWPSQVMAGNTNWSQRGLSSPMQGYPNGLMMTPEQGQALQFLGLTQQTPQSLYGVPVSSSCSVNAFSLNSIDRPGGPQLSGPNNSFSSNNQYAPQQDQVMQGGATVSRPGCEGKSSFEHGSSQGMTNAVTYGSFNEIQQKNVAISESGRQDCAGGSELLPERSETQNTTKQAAVALDPTEQKILFGNEESIWEAFGSTSVVGSGDVNRLDGSDPSNGFPLLQSGTWSALMQSAVAETSSTDVGMQEEWSGLGFQNASSQSGNQQSSACQDNAREPPVWVDRSQRASLDSRNDTIDVNSNNLNSSGLQQPFLGQPRQNLPTDNQISQEGRNWLDSNQQVPHTGKNWALENANPSPGFPKSDICFRTNQQNTFLHNSNDQSSARPSALNFIESVPANGSMTSGNQDNLHDKEHNRHTHVDINHGTARRTESVSTYNVGMGNPLVSSAGNIVPPRLVNKINHESNQKFPDNHYLDFWKSVNSSVQFGIEGSGKGQQNLNEGPPGVESSVTGPNGGAVHETENGDVGENSSESHRLSFSHQTPAGGLRENVWSDSGDRQSFPGGKEKPSEQAAERAAITRKFQYHPMGDLDMDLDSSYASKEILRAQPLPQYLSAGVRSHEAQGRFLGQSNTNSKNLEDHEFFHGASKRSDGVSSSGIHPGHLNNTTPFVRSGEKSSQHQKLSSSQNMLELFHKVDQSTEQTSVSLLNSTVGNRLAEITSGGPYGHSQGQSSTAHGFNLQLAPPSQAIAPSNLNVASQSSSRTVDSLSPGFAAFEKGDKGHAWLASVSSAQYSPSSHPPPQMDSGNDRSGVSGSMGADGSRQNLTANLSAPSASGSPYLRSPLQHHHTVATGGKMIADQSSLPPARHAYLDHQISNSQDQATARQSVSNSLNNIASGRGMNRFGLRGPMHQLPTSSPGFIPGKSRDDNFSPSGAKIWSQQHLLGAQACTAAELLKSQFKSNDAPELSSLSQQQADEQDRLRRGDAASSRGLVGGKEPVVAEAQPTGTTAGAHQEEEHIVKHPLDSSPSNSAASQRDFEAFHHSLKPDSTAQHSYSTLHQRQAMKAMGVDPSLHESKRLKGTDDTPDTQEISGKVVETSAGGAKMLNFSPQPGNRMTSFQIPHGTLTSQETLPFGPSIPQKFATDNVTSRVDHSGISSQMAPSWFQQYGTLRNGQSFSMHKVPRVPMAKNADQQFISGKPSNSLDGCDSMQLSNAMADPGQIANDCETANTHAPNERVSSVDAVVTPVSNPALASIRPKKRKTATSDLLSWSKEVGQGFTRLQNISSAEVDWARSSNRFVEKVEDETDANEGVLWISRPKRRLILTTQLMQQVFRSPSPAILSLVASSSHEIIVYSLARLAVGDACGLVSCSESDSPVHLGSGNLVCGVKTSETRRNQYFSKVVEEFVDRAKELENELLRLDKRASILDFRLDLQDMERFSVINRFARFHGRGQVDGTESSSSSSDPAAVVQRPCPQRYVSAHPMPRNIPDRVQCLSL